MKKVWSCLLFTLLSAIMAGCAKDTENISAGNSSVLMSEEGTVLDNTDTQENADETTALYKVSWEGELFDSDWAPAGFYDSLDTLVWMAYRGGDIIAEEMPADEDAYIAESSQVLEGSDEVEHDVWVRVVQEAVEPESGTIGQSAHKDYMFYRKGEDAYVGIQSAENDGLWTIIKMDDYGDWLEKEIRIYIRMTTGL